MTAAALARILAKSLRDSRKSRRLVSASKTGVARTTAYDLVTRLRLNGHVCTEQEARLALEELRERGIVDHGSGGYRIVNVDALKQAGEAA